MKKEHVMKIDKKFKTIILSIVVILLLTLSIGFALLSKTLTLSSNVEVKPFSLNVRFMGEKTESRAYNGSEVMSEGTINGTSISGLSLRINPKDNSYIETRFSAINNSESANAKLTNINTDYNFTSHILSTPSCIIVHYIDENTTREIPLLPISQLSYEAAATYILENFTEQERIDLDLNTLVDTLNSPSIKDTRKELKLSSFFTKIPRLSISIFALNNNMDRTEIYTFGTDLSQRYEKVLLSKNNSMEERDRIDNYLLEIRSYSSTTYPFPDDYSIKYNNISFDFVYEQIE